MPDQIHVVAGNQKCFRMFFLEMEIHLVAADTVSVKLGVREVREGDLGNNVWVNYEVTAHFYVCAGLLW